MRTCGNVQSRKGLKSPFGEGSGDGLDIPRGNLLRVEPSRGQEEGRTQKVMVKDSAKGVREHGLLWEAVKRMAQNRVRWKSVVEALCSGRSEED